MHVFNNNWYKLLVSYYGIFQFFHLLLNTVYFLDLITLSSFPPPPEAGWQKQMAVALTGIALTDTAVACVSFFFIGAFFLRKHWSLLVGLVSLTTYVYGSMLFTYYTILNGAWRGNVIQYIFLYVVSIPLYVLFIYLIIETSRVTKMQWTLNRK